jgi:hypothetical protein
MSKTPKYTFYVKASTPAVGESMAVADYYTDPACTQQVHSPLSSSRSTGASVFVQAESSELVLMGAVFKTIGNPPVMTAKNFEPATPSADNPALFQVRIPMPKASDPPEFATKGVVLMFSKPGTVSDIYPTADPQVLNDGQP